MLIFNKNIIAQVQCLRQAHVEAAGAAPVRRLVAPKRSRDVAQELRRDLQSEHRVVRRVVGMDKQSFLRQTVERFLVGANGNDADTAFDFHTLCEWMLNLIKDAEEFEAQIARLERNIVGGDINASKLNWAAEGAGSQKRTSRPAAASAAFRSECRPTEAPHSLLHAQLPI